MPTGAPHRPSDFHRIVDVDEFPVDAATPIRAPMVRELFDWWAAAGGGRPPPKRLFDVTNHRRLVANLFLAERQPDDEFRYRVRGEEVLRLLGGSRRGPSVAAHLPKDYGHLLNAYYRRVVDEGVCFGCRGTLAFWDRSNVLFESIDCPLVDDDGVARFVLGVIEPTGRVDDR